MKLLVVTVISEQEPAISTLLTSAGVSAYTRIDATGFRPGDNYNLADSWFSAGTESYDSVVLFSFTDNSTAMSVTEKVREFNNTSGRDFPARAFVMQVDYNS